MRTAWVVFGFCADKDRVEFRELLSLLVLLLLLTLAVTYSLKLNGTWQVLKNLYLLYNKYEVIY